MINASLVTTWLVSKLLANACSLYHVLITANLVSFQQRLQKSNRTANRRRQYPANTGALQPLPTRLHQNRSSIKLSQQTWSHSIEEMIHLFGIKYVSEQYNIPKSTLYKWRNYSYHKGKLRKPGRGRKPSLINGIYSMYILYLLLAPLLVLNCNKSFG